MSSTPYVPQSIPLYQIDLGEESFDRLAPGIDAARLLKSAVVPSIFQAHDIPDFVIVWDHGEGPHNPYGFTDAAYEEKGWEGLCCYPKEIWDFVAGVAAEMKLENDYVLFWLRGWEC